MAELDLSRDIYHALDNAEGCVAITHDQQDEDKIVLQFNEIDIIVDSIQAISLMQELAIFFNYNLVDSDA